MEQLTFLCRKVRIIEKKMKPCSRVTFRVRNRDGRCGEYTAPVQEEERVSKAVIEEEDETDDEHVQVEGECPDMATMEMEEDDQQQNTTHILEKDIRSTEEDGQEYAIQEPEEEESLDEDCAAYDEDHEDSQQHAVHVQEEEKRQEVTSEKGNETNDKEHALPVLEEHRHFEAPTQVGADVEEGEIPPRSSWTSSPIPVDFGSEDISFLTLEMVRDLVPDLDPQRLFLEMMKTTHFNKDYPRNINVYVPHSKSQYGALRENDRWKMCDAIQVVKQLIDKTAIRMDKIRDFMLKKGMMQEGRNIGRFLFNVDRDMKKATFSLIVNHSQLVEAVHKDVLLMIASAM
jgi:hypothetical protein